MSFISGRLIGTKLNFFKQASAATLGVSLTSAMYWFYIYAIKMNRLSVLIDILARKLINCIDALLPSFELFDPIKRGEMDDVLIESRNPISKFFAKIGRQKDICASLLLQ